jgi:hypothetical protein
MCHITNPTANSLATIQDKQPSAPVAKLPVDITRLPHLRRGFIFLIFGEGASLLK